MLATGVDRRRGPRHLPLVPLLSVLAGVACSSSSPAPPLRPPAVDPEWAPGSVARQVDPFIGTHGDGNTFPGPALPWGLVAPSPQTRRPGLLDYLREGRLSGAGYVDDDPRIHGFGLTHLSGAGCPDLGAPVVAATGAALTTSYAGYGASREGERAWAGYYVADLVEPGLRVELTGSRRVAALRFFIGRDAMHVLVDAARSLAWAGDRGRVRLVSSREVEGEVQTGGFCNQPNRQTVYFVARLDRPAAAAGTWKDDLASGDAEAEGIAGAWFRFDATGGRSVEMQVGISFVGLGGARANLEAEGAGRNFDDLRRAARDAWEETLGRVRVEGGTAAEQTLLYTALYHALLHPGVASDVDGSYRRFGGGIGRDPSRERYHLFSLWDTYRTVHPLLTLLYPERQREMVRSLLGMTLEKGAPPKWELAGSEVQMMVGDPAAIVLADTLGKDPAARADLAALAASAWPFLQAAALDTSATPHRPGNASYRALGYVPMEEEVAVWGPVSTTLEYALADFALGRLAAALGVPADPSLAVQAASWQNLVDPATRLFRPRNRDGSWLAPFDPDAIEGSALIKQRAGGPGFVEGTAWHYAFFAPHAVAEHAAATGGPTAYVARLQSLFDTRRFVLWNEPDVGFPYLFTRFPGQGWRTAAAVRDARAAFDTGRGGLPGNDDAGTLSAWYVFSALGLYPDLPAGDDYALGTPLFDRATLSLPGGALVVESPHPTPEHVYVRSARLGGRELGQRLSHSDLAGGGTLQIEMADAPP